MNPIPRRPPRVQPSLRGRSAAVPPFGQKQAPATVVRQRPPISSGHTTIVKVVEKPACDKLHPDWIALYEKWPKLFTVFDRPWKLLIVLLVLIGLSIMLGRLI